jgi:hypothetical protein
LFCCNPNHIPGIKPDAPVKKVVSPFMQGKTTLKNALELIKGTSSSKYKDGTKNILEGLRMLEEVAANKDNCSDDPRAKKLLEEVVKAINCDLHRLDDAARSSIAKASLRAIWKLLQTAPHEVGTTLRREISTNEELRSNIGKILGHTAGCDDETRNYARNILGMDNQEMNHGELS